MDGIRDDHVVRQVLLEPPAGPLLSAVDQNGEQIGVVRDPLGLHRFTTEQLRTKISKIPVNRRHRFYVWSADNKTELTGSASGVDQQAYFANSFLVGFKPYEVTSSWEPLAVLAMRKAYVLDHKLYGPGLAEIWQNSRQAYEYSRGDCEDHAIILADWLIGLGYDARVVLGNYQNNGHAWVVLFLNGQEYVLESTSKRRPRSVSDFLLASLATDYQPMYQFDRERFWVNTGSRYTTRYQDDKWVVRSKFKRTSAAAVAPPAAS